MKIYKGGTAVMLKCPSELHDRLKAATPGGLVFPDWRPVDREDYHLTLRFIGRDLEATSACSSIAAAFLFTIERGEIPIELSFTGRIKKLSTSKGKYLAVEVEKSKALLDARSHLDQMLGKMGVVPKDSFDFNPHVTILEAAPGVTSEAKLGEFAPFKSDCRELIVKYGRHRMKIEI
jgi:2'-5' RNA ligase